MWIIQYHKFANKKDGIHRFEFWIPISYAEHKYLVYLRSLLFLICKNLRRKLFLSAEHRNVYMITRKKLFSKLSKIISFNSADCLLVQLPNNQLRNLQTKVFFVHLHSIKLSTIFSFTSVQLHKTLSFYQRHKVGTYYAQHSSGCYQQYEIVCHNKMSFYVIGHYMRAHSVRVEHM